METKKLLMVLMVMGLVLSWSQVVLAEQKSITLPKGTNVEKMGAGHFKFKLPDGQVVEVKGLVRSEGGAAYVIGDFGIYDPKGKRIASGTKGGLKSTVKPPEQSKGGMIGDTGNYIKIDDDPTYLPAILSFQTKGVIDPEPPGSKR